MFVANVTPILIVLESLGLQNSDVATQAMLGALFMAGLGTAMQLLMGARLPIVIGTSFTFVGVFCTVGASAGGGEAGYYTILGSVLAGGLISTFLCLFVRWWGKLIKPVVPCVVVFAIGLSLLNSGATASGASMSIADGLKGQSKDVALPVSDMLAFARIFMYNGSSKTKGACYGTALRYHKTGLY